jgi:4-amino-4-deoxy-L-arabinose transferase-like glycosyltransferase
MPRRALSTPTLYRLFTIALLAALTIPRMTGRGMFGDGLIHATIARNLSIGVGSLWAPAFTATSFSQYYEHPPLGFVLQAAAFRLLGDHLATERIYSLVVFAATGLLIVAIWRRLQPAEYDWLPVFLFVLPSIVTWAVVNNMLENTQSVFTAAAVLLLLIAWQARSRAAVAGWSAVAAMCVVSATLTKGPVGLFPLAVPFLLMMMPVERKSTMAPGPLALMTLTLVGVTAGCGLALLAYDPARHALTQYVRLQLMPSLGGQREVNADPLATFRHLGLGIAARMAVICGLLWLLARHGPASQRVMPAAFFLTLALCASVPIAVSPKLVGHYFLPSVPFFALGFASLAVRPVSRLMAAERGWHRRVPAALAILLFSGAILVPVLHGPLEARDTELLRELDALEPVMPGDVTIGACQTSGTDWRLQAYVNRLFRVSLEAADRPSNGWFLQPDQSCPAPQGCRLVAQGATLKLHRCQEATSLSRP